MFYKIFKIFVLRIYNESWISDTEHDPPSISNSSFHVEADIWDLSLLCDFFMFFHVL